MKAFLLKILGLISDKLSDDVKKIIFLVSAGIFGLLIVIGVVLGFCGVAIPAKIDGIGEIVKIVAAVIAIIDAKILS